MRQPDALVSMSVVGVGVGVGVVDLRGSCRAGAGLTADARPAQGGVQTLQRRFQAFGIEAVAQFPACAGFTQGLKVHGTRGSASLASHNPPEPRLASVPAQPQLPHKLWLVQQKAPKPGRSR